MLLRGCLRDTGYPICYYFPLFVTIGDNSQRFATIRIIRDYSYYSYYSLFGTILYSLFAIRYSGFPDTTTKRDSNKFCLTRTRPRSVSSLISFQTHCFHLLLSPGLPGVPLGPGRPTSPLGPCNPSRPGDAAGAGLPGTPGIPG